MSDEIIHKIGLVTNRLYSFEDLMPNSKEFENISKEEAEKKGFFARDFGMAHWDWPQGVGIYGLYNNGKGDCDYILNWANTEIAKGLPTKNVNTICPMLTLADFPEFDALTLEWMQWIEEDFPRTKEGALQHITSGDDKFTVKENSQQIWADTVFMTILFMAKMGRKHQNQTWIDDSAYQLLVHIKYLLDRETSLFYHGWNFDFQSNYGGNFWCRGNSWLTMAIPLYLKIVGDTLAEPIWKYFKEVYNNQITALIQLRAEDHLWHTILDRTDSYTETSGSAGIIAGILMGINQKLVTNEILPIFLEESIQGLLEKIDEAGIVRDVSAGTAISVNQKDYFRIIKTPMVYGQAMTLIAFEEYLTYLSMREVND